MNFALPTVSSILGYTGGSMLAFQAVPHVFAGLKDHVNIEGSEQGVGIGSMIMVIIGGSLFIAYGVLENIGPIVATVPVIVLANIIAICLKIWAHIKKKRSDQLF